MHHVRHALFAVLAAGLVLGAASSSYSDEKPKEKKTRPDVPYVPTPQKAVEKMLEMAKVTKDDIVYDLGCGDGRIVITAAKKYGCKAIGIDIDPKRIKEAKENAKKAEVENLVEFRESDVLEIKDIGKATVVTLYMLPEINLKLRPILQKELKPGARIVSHDFDMGTWEPDKSEKLTAKNDDGEDKDCDLLLWIIKKKDK